MVTVHSPMSFLENSIRNPDRTTLRLNQCPLLKRIPDKIGNSLFLPVTHFSLDNTLNLCGIIPLYITFNTKQGID